MIYVFILFGCLISVNIYAYSPFLPAERRPPPPQPVSRNQGQSRSNNGRRPSLSRSNGNSNFGADNRIILSNPSNPAPPRQRPEERPGVYHIGGINHRIREEEQLVVANVIPQSVAEPLNNNNRFIDNIRLIISGKSRNNQETPTTVELESGDQVSPLAQLHDEQGRPPISVRAKRIWWF